MNAYEVKAGIGVIAGNTVWSMPERLRGFTTRRCINLRYFYLYRETENSSAFFLNVVVKRKRFKLDGS